jgi:hypothetical protein
MKKILFLVSIIFALQGCGKKSAPSEERVVMDMAVSEAPLAKNFAGNSTEGLNTTPIASEKKIIRTANIELSSKSLTKSKTAIDTILKKYDGYYENENYSNDYNLAYYLTVRIPAEKFDAFIAAIENGNDKLTAKNISSTDVTMRYMDLESRLKSKRTYLIRLDELAKQAKSVKDLLEVENQTRSLMEEIESSEQEFRYLSKQISMSTISISITQEKEFSPSESTSFGKQIAESLYGGWNILRGLFFVLITIWPLYIIAAVIIFFVRKRRKTKKQKQD